MIEFWKVLQETALRMASVAVFAVFVENILLTRALDTSASLFIIRKRYSRPLFGLILTGIITVSAVVAGFFEESLQSYLWAPLLYVCVVGVVYVLFLLVCARLPQKIRGQLTPMIHLSAFNSAVFGALLLSRNYNLPEHIAYGFGAGIGFLFASYLVEIGYERLRSDKIPPAFRGFPATLIYIGILSLAFYGLIGHELSI